MHDPVLAQQLLHICRFIYADSLGPASDADDAFNEFTDGVIDRIVDIVRLTDDTPIITSYADVLFFPDKTVVVYMGTETDFTHSETFLNSIDDWIQNARLALLPFVLTGSMIGDPTQPDRNLNCRAHVGFRSEMSKVQGKIIAVLKTRHPVVRPLYVTGHSQGGAEAVLGTRVLEAIGIPVTATYTFAAPRAGDIDLVNGIVTDVFRFEFGNDIVPHLAPTLMSAHLTRTLNSPLFRLAIQHAPPTIRQFMLSLNDIGYRSAGELFYGRSETMKDGRNFTRDEELDLMESRLLKFFVAGSSLIGHHHLKPNYIHLLKT